MVMSDPVLVRIYVPRSGEIFGKPILVETFSAMAEAMRGNSEPQRSIITETTRAIIEVVAYDAQVAKDIALSLLPNAQMLLRLNP